MGKTYDFQICRFIRQDSFFIKEDHRINSARLEELKTRRELLERAIPILSKLYESGQRRHREILFHLVENEKILSVLRAEIAEAKKIVKKESEELQKLMDIINPLEIRLEELDKDLQEKEGSAKTAVEDEIGDLKREVKELRRVTQRHSMTIRDNQDVIQQASQIIQSHGTFSQEISKTTTRPDSHGEIDFRKWYQEMSDEIGLEYGSETLSELGQNENIHLRSLAFRKREKLREREKSNQSIFTRVASFFSEESESEEISLAPEESINTDRLNSCTFNTSDFFGEARTAGYLRKIEGYIKKFQKKALHGFLMRGREKEINEYAKAMIDIMDTNESIFIATGRICADSRNEYKRLFFEIQDLENIVATPLDERVGREMEGYLAARSSGANTNDFRSSLNDMWHHILIMIVSRAVDKSLDTGHIQLSWTPFESDFIKYGIFSSELFSERHLSQILAKKFPKTSIEIPIPGVDRMEVHYLDEEISRWFATQDIYTTSIEARGETQKITVILNVESLSRTRPLQKSLQEIQKTRRALESTLDFLVSSLWWNGAGWLEDNLSAIRAIEESLKTISDTETTNNDPRELLIMNIENCLADFVSRKKAGQVQELPRIVTLLANYVNYHRQELQTPADKPDSKTIRIGKATFLDSLRDELKSLKTQFTDFFMNSGGNWQFPPLDFLFLDKNRCRHIAGNAKELFSTQKGLLQKEAALEKQIKELWYTAEKVKSSVMGQTQALRNLIGPNDYFIPFDETRASSDSDFSLQKLKDSIISFTQEIDPLLFTQIPEDTPSAMSENKQFFPPYTAYKRKLSIQIPDDIKTICERFSENFTRHHSYFKQLKSFVETSNSEYITSCFDSLFVDCIILMNLTSDSRITQISQQLISILSDAGKPDTDIQKQISNIGKLEKCLFSLLEIRLSMLNQHFMFNRGSKQSKIKGTQKRKSLGDADLALTPQTHRLLSMEQLCSEFDTTICKVPLLNGYFKTRALKICNVLKSSLDDYKRGALDRGSFKKLRDKTLSALYESAHYLKIRVESEKENELLATYLTPLAFQLEEMARDYYDQFMAVFSEGTAVVQCESAAQILESLEDGIISLLSEIPTLEESLLADPPEKLDKNLIKSLTGASSEIISLLSGDPPDGHGRDANSLNSLFSTLSTIYSSLQKGLSSNNLTQLQGSSRQLLHFSEELFVDTFTTKLAIRPSSTIECSPPNLFILPGNLSVAGFYPPDDISDDDLRKTAEYHEFIRDPQNGNIIRLPMFPSKNVADYLITPLYNFRVYCDKMTVSYRDPHGFIYKKFPRNLWHDKIVALKSGALIHKLLKLHYMSYGKNLARIFTKDNTILPVKGRLERPVINPKKIDELKDFFDMITGVSENRGSGLITIMVSLGIGGENDHQTSNN
ncbi:MAG: hypothetical protein CVV64_08050 [Candidatus Wallbacteria bacterium HGW-Wallbacteria-1]|jgi:hypothetical protein|uniref:Uncharacterized protein n=1 Tax=Candidatus Wallbacteria bacterium HGW-Wallbacteria-1 TaxID=2013854 RepID=A0A2N1PRC6_9BACT|nr:MAG: hypothetical protein CVV64_08050 [Candidatus Wallbacteria bacterium HGW-Wallbacteria-1]